MTYLNHMASHDQLTGLPGRTLLRERIAEAIEKAMLHGRKVAVFVIDLDHFKRMNDSLGHRAGDEIIVGMAERMRQSLRRSDTLGRLGGDEFIVVMPHIATLADVERCAKRLVDRVSSTAQVGDMEVNLTASVGVCVYPDFAEDVDSLLERADAATYAAKENGRNQFQVFSEAMLKESQERLSMDTALRHALVREELFLHYQPLVSLTTGRVIGMEALLRWHHPKLGVISPATFIPLAEDTGLIVAIGEWALKQSCIQAKTLCDELGMDLSVSVNLSPRQFEQHNLLQVIDDALEDQRPSREEPAGRIDREHADDQLGVEPREAATDSSVGRARCHRRLRHGILQLLLPAAVSGRPAEDRPELRDEGSDGAKCRDCGADHRGNVAPPGHQGNCRGRGNAGPPEVPGANASATRHRDTTSRGQSRRRVLPRPWIRSIGCSTSASY